MVTAFGNGLGIKILDDAVCISQNANNIWKSMNPAILSPAMDK